MFGDGLAADARSEDRTLSFKQLHTGETVTITFKRNGRYDSEGLKKINYILRDWRRNESTTMDPALLDLVWEVRKSVGSNAPVYVLSGYRSPVTNAMLRSRSRGVAQQSQHMVGKALDFYLPDVPLSRLRETALKHQRGGVGYYPTSGSPFVHMDTGNVRHWPRMTRSQLAKLFPDGKTVHIPSDGKPMPGYNEAVAELKRGITTRMAALSPGSSRQQFVATYPRLDPSVAITAASVERSSGSKSGSGRSLIAALFESGEDGDEEGASNTPEASTETSAPQEQEPAPAPTVVAALAPNAPVPTPRLKPVAEIPPAEAPPAITVAAADTPIPMPKPVLVASLEPAAQTSAPETSATKDETPTAENQLMTASVPPPTLVASLPRERPMMAGTDAIASLIARNDVPAADMRPESTAATALAPIEPRGEMPPFASTFTGIETQPYDKPVLVAIDYRPEAIQPYMDPGTCLRDSELVSLRHPDQNDIGSLTTLTGPVVVNRFSEGPQLAYPMRRFTGPAVAPVATRSYQMASAAPDQVITGSISPMPTDRSASLR